MLRKLGFYQLLEIAGSGSFGNVYHAIDTRTHRSVAIKTISNEYEIEIMKHLDFPFICPLYEVIDGYAVLEFVESGTIMEYVNKYGSMSEATAKKIFHQLILAIQYLHDNNIIHRDIKAENILIDSEKNIRLIDFGLATDINEFNKRLEMCGSPDYASPEMLNQSMYDFATDIWSAGVVLYAISTGRLPFHKSTVEDTVRCVLSNNLFFPQSMSESLANLISGMLETTPSNRFTVEEILKHPWLEARKIDISKFMIKTIDNDLIAKIKELGVDIEQIKLNIANDIYDDVTSLYRIYRRSKISELMRMQSRHVGLYKAHTTQSANLSSPQRQFLSLAKFSMHTRSMIDKGDIIKQILCGSNNLSNDGKIMNLPMMRKRRIMTMQNPPLPSLESVKSD